MYYNRTISKSFSKMLETGGELRWLFNFVKKRNELDFLIGKNKQKEWISIYRGLSRILTITGKQNYQKIKLDAAKSYKDITCTLYGIKSVPCNFKGELEALIKRVGNEKKFDRYYNNRKEGFFQNELSRKFGICGRNTDEFVILDKEAVVGFANRSEKKEIYDPIRAKYKQLQRDISFRDSKRYGKDLDKKAIGNELDFVALDKNGNILLIEYKHATNTSGIYLSPLQIGMYHELFSRLPKKLLFNAVHEMLEQKKRIGLINSKWNKPEIGEIIPVLVISEYNYNQSAKKKFQEIMNFTREKIGHSFLRNIKTYNYTTGVGLKDW